MDRTVTALALALWAAPAGAQTRIGDWLATTRATPLGNAVSVLESEASLPAAPGGRSGALRLHCNDFREMAVFFEPERRVPQVVWFSIDGAPFEVLRLGPVNYGGTPNAGTIGTDAVRLAQRMAMGREKVTIRASDERGDGLYEFSLRGFAEARAYLAACLP